MILTTIKSLRWADFYLFSLLDPRSLYRKINANDPKPFALSFTVPAMVAITEIITMSLFNSQTGFFYFKISYGWILYFLYASVKIIILCALMDLLAQFLGHKGNIKEIISLVNFALLPHIFLLPLMYIFVIINFATVFFYFFFSFILIIWSAAIVVPGISEMHNIEIGRAILIMVFPYIFLGTTLFFIALLLIIGLFSFLS